VTPDDDTTPEFERALAAKARALAATMTSARDRRNPTEIAERAEAIAAEIEQRRAAA
jgi:hypothetical protein